MTDFKDMHFLLPNFAPFFKNFLTETFLEMSSFHGHIHKGSYLMTRNPTEWHSRFLAKSLLLQYKLKTAESNF